MTKQRRNMQEETAVRLLSDKCVCREVKLEYEIKACNILKFPVCVQYFKFSFHYMCCQARLSL